MHEFLSGLHYGLFFRQLIRSPCLTPGWPDWANFRLLGNYLLWVVFVKITEVAQKNWAIFFKGKSFVLIMTKNGLGYTLGDFFTLIRSPWMTLTLVLFLKKNHHLLTFWKSRLSQRKIDIWNSLNFVTRQPKLTLPQPVWSESWVKITKYP
jgi:hypothetical protein